MSVPDRSIDPRLLSAAKEEFLKKGYKMASLAEICGAAGVTTGALYKRYEGKEDLFSALVEDTVREADISQLTDRQLYDSFIMTPGSIRQWMRILEGHRDGFTLLVRCASGTRYENFHHDWTETMNELNYKYYREARRRGMADRELSREEMLVLSSAVWAMYFEPFYHDFTPEQIGRQAKLMHDFISWPRVLALKKPDHE